MKFLDNIYGQMQLKISSRGILYLGLNKYIQIRFLHTWKLENFNEGFVNYYKLRRTNDIW